MALPETLTLVYDATEPYPHEIPLGDVYRSLALEGSPDRPAIILNMVQTLDGAVALDGKAWTLGSEVDHYLYRTLRGWADAVLSGAGTLRLNDVVATTHPHLQTERATAGRSANPAGVVVSRRAEFDEATLEKRFFTRRDFVSIVLTTHLVRPIQRRRIEDSGVEVMVVPATAAGEVDLAAAVRLLGARGMTRILVEGGPATNRHLVDAGLLDEWFLTVTPHLAGVPNPARIVTGPLGGARARLRVISELQYRAPQPLEWYFRFTVSPTTRACSSAW
ncbi:MAG: dihydrofolate reductase family protein [bacterium]